MKVSANRIVLKLSGSTFYSAEFPGVVKAVSEFYSAQDDLLLVVVAGGGKNARQFIAAGKRLGLDQASLDDLGIAISRLNAQAVIACLGTIAYPSVPKNLAELVDSLSLVEKHRRHQIYACGGFHPGQSTNAVAALIAEKIRGRFVNATDVDGVFDKDPNRYSDAILLESVALEELRKILSSGSMAAGGYDLMDAVALGIIERSNIPTTIIRSSRADVSRALAGRCLKGTRIRPANE